MNSKPRKRVLVCDDDLLICDWLQTELEMSGYEPRCVHGHRDCVRQVQSFKPDVILMDVQMPEKDGFTLVEELLAAGLKTPIIFMTAYGGVTYRLFAPVLKGNVSYLRKPMEPEELKAKIERVSASRASDSSDGIVIKGLTAPAAQPERNLP